MVGLGNPVISLPQLQANWNLDHDTEGACHMGAVFSTKCARNLFRTMQVHAKTCVSGASTSVSLCLRSFSNSLPLTSSVMFSLVASPYPRRFC